MKLSSWSPQGVWLDSANEAGVQQLVFVVHHTTVHCTCMVVYAIAHGWTDHIFNRPAMLQRGWMSWEVLRTLLKWGWSSVLLLQYRWTPILFLHTWPCTWPSDKSPRRNGMISHQIMPTDSSFLFPLPCHYSLLGQNTRSRSANLYLQHFSFVWLWLPLLDRARDLDCQSTSPMFPLSVDNHF